MKILLFSNYDVFGKSIISRMQKEGHQVFVVTGNREKRQKAPRQVFQEYIFPFDSESIEQVIQTVQPDVVIYKGMLDAWHMKEQETKVMAKGMAGLTNVVHQCLNQGAIPFVYLSTLGVYEKEGQYTIDETTVPYAQSSHAVGVLAGEKVCQSYYNAQPECLAIVRLGELYGIYQKDIMLNLNFQDFEGPYLNQYYPLIYTDDATDYIYQLITMQPKEQVIYHVAPKNTYGYTGIQVLEWMGETVEPEEDKRSDEAMAEQPPKIFMQSFHEVPKYYEKYQPKDVLPKLVGQIKLHRHNTIKDNESSSSKKKRVRMDQRGNLHQFLENVAFFLLVQIFIFATSGFDFHETIDVYMLYVLVTAVIYGYLQGIFAVAFSTVGRLYMHLATDSAYIRFEGDEIYLWIIQIFVIGALVGYLKEKYRRKDADHKDDLEYLQLEIDALKTINDSNVQIKDAYENRLLNYRDSFARIYDLVSRFDVIEPEKVVFKAVKAVGDTMKSQDVAIYSFNEQSQYCRLTSATSKKAQQFGKTLRLSDYSMIYDKLMHSEIYINTKLDETLPMMVGGAYLEGKLQSVIVVWSLPFASTTLYDKNNFGILCRLIGSSLSRANEYMESINMAVNFDEMGILEEDAFAKVIELYMYGEQENVVDYTVLRLKSVENEQQAIGHLKSSVRDTDYIGRQAFGQIAVLLTNTNEEEAQYVVRRLADKGIEVQTGVNTHVG